jgi:hypothetical protein
MRVAISLAVVLLWATCPGCGTTKWTDTTRTATEQLLITDSVDRAVSRLDLRALAGKKVFVDDTPAKQVTDAAYLVSAIRQHVLASGAILKDKREDAEYILEVRAGAVGTDRHDLLFGMPATTLPTIGVMGAAVPTQIPEIALAKKTDQRGVAKISLFAYNRETGRPVWQSGAVPEQSTTKAFWLLGAGPFQRGTIHRGTTFAGAKLHIPLIDPAWADDGKHAAVAVADEAFFVEPKEPPSSSAKPPVAGTPGKDQSSPATAAAAKPADAPTATASPTAATTPPPASPATATAPVVPNRQIDRIGDVPTGPPPGATGPAPAADFRPAAPPSTPEVSPTGAIMPFGPFSTPMTPSEETFRGDTWLDRRR